MSETIKVLNDLAEEVNDKLKKANTEEKKRVYDDCYALIIGKRNQEIARLEKDQEIYDISCK